ncbi:MAG TPA: nuclear transport factor 2 family protein [Stellaceae bacterium]|nr:nuclear transport factor 2 family protein [Stellaceae bacterium]
MSTVTDLIDRYIEMWNETDGVRRRELVAHVWTEGARYLDPVLEGKGRSGIEAMIRGVQERFPGHRFRRTSAVDSHHDVSRRLNPRPSVVARARPGPRQRERRSDSR